MISLFDVSQQSILSTGGTQGIGLMLARGFVESGARVCITARNPDDCATLATELSHQGR